MRIAGAFDVRSTVRCDALYLHRPVTNGEEWRDVRRKELCENRKDKWIEIRVT